MGWGVDTRESRRDRRNDRNQIRPSVRRKPTAAKANASARQGASWKASNTAWPDAMSTLPSNPVSRTEIANLRTNWLVKVENTAERTAAKESELCISTPGVCRILDWWGVWLGRGGKSRGSEGLLPMKRSTPQGGFEASEQGP